MRRPPRSLSRSRRGGLEPDQAADAGAADIEMVDPDEEHLIATPPEISFAVATAKFTGRLAVLCDTRSQSYAVELRANGATAARAEDITVTALAAGVESMPFCPTSTRPKPAAAAMRRMI